MFRSAFLILSGNAAASLLLLARNLIIARMIPVADYGIAATFAIAMSVVEMMSALGLQQQIVQAKQGDDPRFQAALQGFQVLRGVIAAGILFLLAGPIADFLAVPDVAWAYRVMALVPMLNACVHFDIYRLNRSMVFWPVILTGAVPALFSVLIIWPLALWYGDYQVMLYSIIAQAGVTVLTSHVVAHRPYRLILDRKIMSQSLRFGWPLLANGALLFAVFNGDKLIVGRELGMEVLAIFAMGFTLTLAPTLVMAKSAQNFFLPQLSGNAAPEKFVTLANVTIETVMLMGLILVVITVLVGQPVVLFLLGPKYMPLLPLLTWLAIMQAVRVFKAGPAIVALATGQTSNALIANFARVLSLPLAWYVAVTSGDVLAIIWIAIVGELIGHAIAMLLLFKRSNLSPVGLIVPHLGACFLLTLGAGQAHFSLSDGFVGYLVSWAWLPLIIGLSFTFWTMHDLRNYIATRSRRQIIS